MIRLFVAIRPPDAVRDALLDIMGGVSGARWQSDDQLHLTLRFIGEVDRHAASDIAAALGHVRHPPFDAEVGGIGSFASRGRANAIWAGAGPAAALTTLHHKVDQALVRAGIAQDGRAFHPHITLARLGRGSGEITAFVARTSIAAQFTVDGFGLFESILAREAADYRLVEHYDLDNNWLTG